MLLWVWLIRIRIKLTDLPRPKLDGFSLEAKPLERFHEKAVDGIFVVEIISVLVAEICFE